MRPQSIGAIQRRRKNWLTQTWNRPNPPTLPFCPATKKTEHLLQRMSMATIGFVAHDLRPSIPEEAQQELGSKEPPRTVTGNTYSIFTTKNYEDSKMPWFWMVLVCLLLLFAYWKLRRFCRCPGPSKDERRARKEAKWHKHQLDEIEKQIEKYERKLEEIKALRSSLGLDGVTLNNLAYSRDAGQSLGDWTTCLLYTSPSPRDRQKSRMPSSA